MVDQSLPFGGSKCLQIFNRITHSVRVIMLYTQLVVYLDGFIVTARSYEECLVALETPLRLLLELGFAISYKKIEGPTQNTCFLRH